MNARTRTFPLVGENSEMDEKYARRPKRIRTPRSGKATINADRILLSAAGMPLISLALLAMRRNRQI